MRAFSIGAFVAGSIALVIGLFLATLTGPGRVFLQTLPFSRMADRIVAASKMGGGTRRDEGSVLGGLFTGDDS